jgi:hypothetical protein
MQNKITLGVALFVLVLSGACSTKPSKAEVDSKNTVTATSKSQDSAVSSNEANAAVVKKTIINQPMDTAASKQEILQNRLEAHTCKNGVETRTLWIEKIMPSGCKLWYSNYKKTGPAAWSANGHEHCLKVQRQIIGNLGVGSFTCVQN